MPDPEVKPAVEPVVVPAIPVVEPAAPVAPPAASEAKKDEPAKPSKSWEQDRIRVLTAKLNEEREKNAKGPAPVAEAKPGESEADVTARIRSEASRIAAEEKFTEKADAVATKARETYGKAEFDSRLTNIQSTINQRDPIEVGQYVRLIQTSMETDDPGKVIFLLGEDPARAAEIMAMPPTKMALEVAKLAIAEAPGVSKTAAPLTLVEANGQADRREIDPSDPARSDKLSTAEFMKRRREQHKVLFGRA